MESIRRGLAQLVSRKRAQDRVAVLSFANDFQWDARWESSPVEVEKAFRNLRTRGNRTRLYDAVSRALDELDLEGGRSSDFPARRAILVLSDGHDEGSETTLQRQVERLSASRVRLDAVGLARSPVWLRSLQRLATAGFGMFRTAGAPEDLTDLLERGLDILLETPAVEFSAEHLKADGRSHGVGVEHTPTGWRDVASVEIPDNPFYADVRVWLIGGIAAAVAIVFGGVLLSRSRKPPVPVSKPASVPEAPVAAARRNSVPAHRTVTVAETEVPPVPSYVPSVAPAGAVSADPVRSPTVLAPQTSLVMFLEGVSGSRMGQRVEVAAHEFWIGSAPNNNLCLSEDPAVSGNHACIRREGTIYRLYDNGSLNDTWVNGKPTGTSVALLKHGDHIIIGQTEFAFQS
jgi:hypothetical protein